MEDDKCSLAPSRNGIHHWREWVDKERITHHQDKIVTGMSIIQERNCLWCHRVQLRQEKVEIK
jgi:hypothetical protein